MKEVFILKRKIEFGRALKELRNSKKLNQQELAKRLGVTQATISKYEKGENFPTFEILVQLSEIFDVSLDELVYKARPAAADVIEQNQQFLDDVLNDMPLEELISKYNIQIDGRRATLDEAKKAINAIRFDRFNSNFN